MDVPDISVVVVSWRTRALTLECLASVEADARESRAVTEILLVDNDSRDGTVEAVDSEHPEVTVIASPRNVGFAAGCNLAIERGHGRYVLLLNPDARIARGTIDRLVDFLDAHDRAGVAGARLTGATGEDQFSCGRFLTPFNQTAEVLGLPRLLPSTTVRRSYTATELGGEPTRVDWVTGACMAIRREALDEVGPFDEAFFMYSEDEDLCYRMRAAGWEVWFLPKLRVVHVGGGSSSQVSEAMRGHARASQARFVAKHRGHFSAALFRLLHRIASLKPGASRDGIRWGR